MKTKKIILIIVLNLILILFSIANVVEASDITNRNKDF